MSKDNTNCTFCNSTNYLELYQIQDIFNNEFQLVECNNCACYYLTPQPNQAQLEQAYDQSYYGEGESKFNKYVEGILDWFRARKAKQFARLLTNNASVLDIGCGNGNFLNYLSKCGDYELHGIEPAGKSAQRASKYDSIKLKVGYLDKLSYPIKKFDAVSLIHVFEHLPNPKETIEIINTITKDQALLYLELPNIDSWQAKIFKQNWFHLDPPRHLLFFNPTKLKAIFKAFGWELLEESYISPQFSPFGVQQSFLNTFVSRRDLLYESLKGNKSYAEGFPAFKIWMQKLFHWITYPLFVFTDFLASTFNKGGTVKLIFKKGLNLKEP